MNLNLVAGQNRTWTLSNQRRQVAQLVMDYFHQLDEVVLFPGLSPEETLAVLQRACSHATRFVVDRQFSPRYITPTHHGLKLDEASAQVLKLESDPQLANKTVDELKLLLANIGVAIIFAKVNSFYDALKAVTADPRLRVGVSFQLSEPNFFGERYVTFTVKSPAQFRIWHHFNEPGSGIDLYVVPAYHPVMQKRFKSTNMINGATDALIGGRVVRAVYAPSNGSQSNNDKTYGSSWVNVEHPFFAVGKQVVVKASSTKILSAEGLSDVTDLLLAMLELENTYVSVSGGFKGKYPHPQDVADTFYIRTASRDGAARGSEGYCVWAYQVLRQENQLSGAYIPPWFFRENWLEAYETYGYKLAE